MLRTQNDQGCTVYFPISIPSSYMWTTSSLTKTPDHRESGCVGQPDRTVWAPLTFGFLSQRIYLTVWGGIQQHFYIYTGSLFILILTPISLIMPLECETLYEMTFLSIQWNVTESKGNSIQDIVSSHFRIPVLYVLFLVSHFLPEHKQEQLCVIRQMHQAFVIR